MMDNVREKLVELLYAAHCKTAYVPSAQMYEKGVYYPEKLFEEADHLISHGVTIQERTPVTERLPVGPDWMHKPKPSKGE